MRNTYVNSEENIKKPPLLHEVLTDHTQREHMSQPIIESKRRNSNTCLSMNKPPVKHEASIITVACDITIRFGNGLHLDIYKTINLGICTSESLLRVNRLALPNR